ncbi:MAG: MFS transporter [Gammaproteobacteria bacterium]|nr:MFS transporter [Gammaproteobacteria bacterium]
MLKGLKKQLLIQEGETGNVVYFLAVFLLVGSGMAIGRGTADALFLKRLGIEYLPMMYMIQSLLLAAVSLVYAAFADRIIAEKFCRIIFSVLTLLVFASWVAMSRSDGSLVYPLYYLLYEIASEILLVHAALYMSQNMTTMQAKRLAPLLYAGSQMGIILGGLLLAAAVPIVGTQNMLLVWCALLLPGVLLIITWHRRKGPSTHFRAPPRGSRIFRECTNQVKQGLRYSWSSELLRAGSFALFFMVTAFYILCYSTHRVYAQTFETEADLAGFYGMLTAATSSIALLIQIFVTNKAIRRYGVRRINLLFPLTTLTAMSALAVSFTLPAALFGSFNKDAIMPAFRNPVRTLFYSVIPTYIQGRARAISVAVVLPAALFFCGLLLSVMQKLDSPEFFLLPGMAAALVYLHFNRRMNRAYEGTLINTLKERLFLPDKRLYSELHGASKEVLDEIVQGLNHEDPEVAIAFARLLAGSFPEQAAELIFARIDSANTATADQLLGLLGEIDLSQYRERLYKLAERGDEHFQATVIHQLAGQKDPGYLEQAANLLEHANPRLRAAGIHFCLHQPATGKQHEQLAQEWLGLIQGNTGTCKAGLTLIPDLSLIGPQHRERLEDAYQKAFVHMLTIDATNTRISTLNGLSRWERPLPDTAYPALLQALSDDNPETRAAATRCLPLKGNHSRTPHILHAASDSHPGVREAGVNALKAISEDYSASVLRLILENTPPLRGQIALLESLEQPGLPKVDCERLAINKAEEACQLQDALTTMEAGEGPDSPAGSLIRLVLQERLNQTIQLALLALEPLYEAGTVKIIRAGFASGDRRHIENAIEVLGNLECCNATKLLLQVLTRMHDDQRAYHAPGIDTINGVIEWCATHPDKWLQQCAEYFIQETKTEDARV